MFIHSLAAHIHVVEEVDPFTALALLAADINDGESELLELELCARAWGCVEEGDRNAGRTERHAHQIWPCPSCARAPSDSLPQWAQIQPSAHDNFFCAVRYVRGL